MNKRNRLYVVFGFLGFLLFLLAAWQINAASAGLVVKHTIADGIPIEFVAPVGAKDSSRPLVLIGHGFAGSSVFMRGFAYTFAKAGYVAALWDFDGHGANPHPLPAGALRGDLVSNAESVLAEARRLGLADPSRLAFLGHSMGSGVALSFGQVHPATMATIAVSPVSLSVTPDLPHNLLLLAGSNEPTFVQSAQQLLTEAGGEGGNAAAGTARKLVVIRGVEHITIVLSLAAQRTARDWLDATFGLQPGGSDYTDLRVLWYGLGVLGALLATLFLVPPSAVQTEVHPLPLWRRLLAMAAGGLGATLLLWLLSRLGVDLSGFLGLMVGGYLLVWFAVAGLIAMFIMGFKVDGFAWRRQSLYPGWPLSGLLVGLSLWLGVGLLGGQVWLPWLLIPSRLVLWPLGVVCALPWFLAMGQACYPASGWGRLGWFLGQSLTVVGALMLALRLTPGIFFLVLILPVFPLILGAHALGAGRQRNPWAYALSAVLLIPWAVLAVFPLGG